MATSDSIKRGSQYKDETGHSYGRLTVISYAGLSRQGDLMWTCRCECGSEIITRGSSLRCGNTKSCGCYRVDALAEANTLHGLTKSPEYGVWKAMIARCTNPNDGAYADYGGRGIFVCEKWRKFTAFSQDMGSRPSDKHTIERVDNSLGYSKENCKWATRKEQQRNTRQNHLLTHNGQTLCIAAWAESLGMTHKLISSRLDSGWSVERALTTPVNAHHKTVPS